MLPGTQESEKSSEPVAKPTKEERDARIKARHLLRKQLANGPSPDRVVAIAFVEKGLKNQMVAAADDFGVRTQRG